VLALVVDMVVHITVKVAMQPLLHSPLLWHLAQPCLVAAWDLSG
jgi:hypothetical protein